MVEVDGDDGQHAPQTPSAHVAVNCEAQIGEHCK